MIQDIAPHIYHNEYLPHHPQKDSVLLCYDKDRIFMNVTDGEITFPTYAEAEAVYPAVRDMWTYLFTIDETAYYLISRLPFEEMPDYTFEKTDSLRTLSPRHLIFAGITGHQLYKWYKGRRFCGSCGRKMKPDKKERMMYCPHCQTMEYPKLSPAVIVAVRNGDKLLLSKYAGREFTNYALIAGFAEIGEPIEDTVRREVMEEVGLKVKNIRFYKSQPWSFSDTLLFGFFCDLDGDDTIRLDEEELALAEWHERSQIPDDAYEISLTREMMTLFKNGLDDKLSL